MASQALGQGYQGSGGSTGSTGMSGVAAELIKIGGRRAAFKEQMAINAMDHELTGIREGKAREWQSGENALDRGHAVNMFEAKAKADALMQGAQQIHETTLQGAAHHQERTLARHAAKVASRSRRQEHVYGIQSSYQAHEQAKEMANLHTDNTIRLAAAPGYGGSHSATGTGATMQRSETEKTEVSQSSSGGKRKAGTAPAAPDAPSTPMPDMPSMPEAPSASNSSSATKRFRLGPKPGGPVRPIGQKKKAKKEDRSGGILGMDIPGL